MESREFILISRITANTAYFSVPVCVCSFFFILDPLGYTVFLLVLVPVLLKIWNRWGLRNVRQRKPKRRCDNQGKLTKNLGTHQTKYELKPCNSFQGRPCKVERYSAESPGVTPQGHTIPTKWGQKKTNLRKRRKKKINVESNYYSKCFEGL